MKNINLNELKDKKLLSGKIGLEASKISKDIKIRKLVDRIQKKYAKIPPKKYKGSCFDGRDITYNIMPNANFKFFITAKLETRARRRFKELKKLDRKIKYIDVLNGIKKRDKSDRNRKISPLKKTKDSILINTTKLTIKECFKKIKSIIDKDLEI